jgi:hypothetical protein
MTAATAGITRPATSKTAAFKEGLIQFMTIDLARISIVANLRADRRTQFQTF